MNLIFDIGANNGDYTDHFSKQANRVVAFEPNPQLVARLNKRFAGTNVVVDKRAISSITGTQSFHICDAPTLSTFSQEWIDSSRFSADQTWEISIDVPTTTIDNAIAEYGIPDYIKIDVEGYEYEVLQGLTQCLTDTIISFEWAEEDSHIQKSIDYLQQLGYSRFFYTDGDSPCSASDILWATWENLHFFSRVVPERKQRWGMIYCKKEKQPGDREYNRWDSEYFWKYINLDSRSDRREHMQNEFSRVGIHANRLQALLPTEVDQPADKLYVMQNRTPGAIGCHYSQVRIMEQALAAGKHAVVFEDDLVFCDDFHSRLEIVQQFMDTHDWDIIWLGGTYHTEPTWHRSENGQHTHPDLQMCHCDLNRDWEPTDNPHVVRTYGCWSTYAYIVNYNSLQKILDLLDQNVYRSMGIDWLFILLQPNLYTFAFNPGCVKQFDNQSNIGDDITHFSVFELLGPHWYKQTL